MSRSSIARWQSRALHGLTLSFTARQFARRLRVPPREGTSPEGRLVSNLRAVLTTDTSQEERAWVGDLSPGSDRRDGRLALKSEVGQDLAFTIDLPV